MGRIQARVTQAGGNDDNIAALGLVNITVSLNPEDSSTSVPSGISCSLAVGSGSAITPIGPGTPNSSRGINLTYSYNLSGGTAVGQSYTLSNFSQWSISDVDGTTGTVQTSTPAARAAAVLSQNPASVPTSLWNKVLQFIRRLFGQK